MYRKSYLRNMVNILSFYLPIPSLKKVRLT